ncbi:MAG: O-antigen ligase family protein [Solirubrobacteraceae bacterium]
MKALPVTPVRFLRALPLAVVAVLGAYGLIATAGVLGVVLLLAILLLAGALAVWTRSADVGARSTIRRTATAALLTVPAALVVFFSFSSGGFFPDSVALGTLAVGVLLVVRLAVADRPLASFGPAVLVPLAGLAGLAGWALLSQFWSHAPGRATIGFDRDLLYALTFALFASLGSTRARLTWAVRAVAFTMAGVAALSLISRVAPDVLSTSLPPQADGRLAYPLTYWNALGVFCAVAGILVLHLAASDGRRVLRVVAAGALPVLGATLLFTYSRGGLLVAVVGLAVYAVLGRPRGLLSALIAAAPGTAIAMRSAYDATLLSGANPTSPAAVHQGHHVALVVLGCVASAVVLRALLLALDAFLEGDRSPIDRHRPKLRGAALAAALVAVIAAIALGAPGAIAHRWNQFVNQQATPTTPLIRSRLTSASNNGRIELWDIAFDAFKAHPLDGTGAETFETLFYQHRNSAAVVVVNAHSLYIETLGELGIVGLILVALFVLGTLAGLAPFRRGRDRALYAALFSAGLAWALHAGVDWDWQMPAASLWFAALGGLALGRRTAAPDEGAPDTGARAVWPSLRALLAGALVLGACVFPALVLASQVRLNDASNAYADGNCTLADRFARSSIDVLGTRAPPWQIEALCAVRAGDYPLAQTDLRSGLAVDPDDWQLEAALAASIAATGSDARPQAARALALNPQDSGVQALAKALAGGPSLRGEAAARSFLSQQSLLVSG